MATTGSYVFRLDTLRMMQEAYERCGLFLDNLTGQQVNSALNSMNLLFGEWAAQDVNLWAVEKRLMPYQAGMNAFSLPAGSIDVREAYRRTSTYPADGTADSSPGGTAANAFDGTDTSACTQTGIDGTIGYNFGSSKLVSVLGVKAAVLGTYTLVGESSDDGSTWTGVYTGTAHVYPAGTFVWTDLDAPYVGSRFRIRETGGTTLSITQLGFNTDPQDIFLTKMGRDQYGVLPNKAGTGEPVQYWVDRQIDPKMYVWPAMDNGTNILVVYRQRYLQDMTLTPTDNPDIPQRHYEALCAGLAAKLAVKVAPDRLPMLAQLSQQSLAIARRLEVESGDIAVTPDISGYYQW